MKKNIWKYILILGPIIVAALLLFPTYRAYVLESEEEELLASKDTVRIEQFRQDYGEDLRNAISKRIKLGLDLRGGMYVMLEVDVLKLIEESSLRESRDDVFEQVLEKTKKETDNSDEPVLDVFLRNFKAMAEPKGRSLITYFDTGDSQDLSDAKIIEQLQNDINSAIDQAKEVIRQRIDKYGVSEPSITKQGTRRIVVELPGVKDQKQMRDLLQTTARLEFKLLRNNQEIPRSLLAIDKYLNRSSKPEAPAAADTAKTDTAAVAAVPADTAKTAANDTSAIAKADSGKKDTATQAAKKDTTKNPYAGLSDEEARKRYQKDHPVSSLVATYFVENDRPQQADGLYIQGEFPEGEYMFRVSKSTYEKLVKYLERSDVRKLLPADYQLVRGAKALTEPGTPDPVYELYSLKRDPELTGDAVTNAVATFDPATNEPIVMMEMDSEGADRWAAITGANIKKRVAIVLDEQVYSAPVVQNKIPNGVSTITGMQNLEEANLLQIVLKAGALKAPVKIIEEQIVGPSLGKDSISQGLTASAIAFALVIIFMMMYYAKGGLVANLAVIINVILLISALSAFQGTLTLPGIAGIILTIGMAVDANILIYERVREELARGRSLRGAIDEGFKKAFTAILDSNVTTFLTGMILYFLGTGPIQGFALTLMIGILTTLFTAITVSRAIIEIMLGENAVTFNFGQPKQQQA